jgi:ribosomal protein S18 acetylase RimI-like enzyme
MQISHAALEDAHAVAVIHVSAWQAAYRGIVPSDYLDGLSVEKREASWRAAIAGNDLHLLVAKLNDHIVGWVAFGACRDAGAATTHGEIWAIYVAPAHWSCGVGRAHWLAARTALVQLGFKNVSLWVLAANARAIRFYLGVGFVKKLGSDERVKIGGVELLESCYAVEIVV